MRRKEITVGRPLLAVRLLAAISVVLALMCAALAVAWKREHDRVGCFQDAAEQERVPQDRECAGTS
ncbi:hypothetical protein [Phenylobacterium sp.]|uniref:hypothetical protein n=1 Tax=Phenylobacterium sp. TaxID=1871053 RepID=UPI002F40D225